MISKWLIVAFTLATTFAWAQTNPFSKEIPANSEGIHLCKTSELSHELYKNDPSVRQKFNNHANKPYISGTKSASTFGDGITRIPINFIVVHNNGPENISQIQIESQVRILNESFRKLAGTPGSGNGVDTEIEFFLAQKNPSGNCVDGIERHQSTLTVHNSGSPQLANTFPPMDVTKYLNVYVVERIGAAGTTIGYTYLPSANNGSNAQNCIYIAHHAIGDVGTAGTFSPNISSGTVLAHEIGHWLDLLHVFEPNGSCPGGNCNTTGDRCCDTQPQRSQSPPGCNPVNSCGSPNNINNYMDYGTDACFNMFTADQKTRMENVINNLRPALSDSMNALDAGLNGCLGITYCQSQANNTSGTEIRNVSLASLNNNTSNECTGFSDFKTTFTELTQDSSYTLSVTTGHCTNGTAPNHEVKAYIDWNRDGDFIDAGEEYLVKSNGPAGTGTVTITVPGNAPLDRTGMRIVATDGGVTGPCNTYAFGETEDYGLQFVAPPPTITSFTPTSGPIAQNVTISGDNFSNATSVTFNNTTTIFHTVVNDSTITVNVPANSTTGPVTVTTPRGFDVSTGNFTVTTLLPAVTNFTPDSGFVGDPVTIFGQNLGTVQQVYFNGVPVTNFNQVGAIQVNTTVPPAATSGPIQVQNNAGTASSANAFVVRVPATTASISGNANICNGSSTDLTFNMTGTPPFNLIYTDGTNNYIRNGVTSPYTESVTPGTGVTTYTIVSVGDTNLVVTAPDPAISGSAVINVLDNPTSAQLNGSTTICEGDTTSFTFNVTGGTGPYNIEIDNGIGLLLGVNNGDVIDVSPNTSTNYSLLLVQDNSGCGTSNFTSSANINVLPGPGSDFTFTVNKSIVTFTDQSSNAISWSWDFGDSTGSTQQNPVHVYQNIGIKKVVLTTTNNDGCSDSYNENVLVLEVSGLDGLSINETLNLYPNPANDNLNAELMLDKKESVALEILSLDGKVIQSALNSEKTRNHSFNMNISELPSGVYMVRFNISDGRILNTKVYKN